MLKIASSVERAVVGILLGALLIVVAISSGTGKAEAYQITVPMQTETTDGHIRARICWDFKDPSGVMHHWCTGDILLS